MNPDDLRSEARRWLALAARDLRAARLLVFQEPVPALFHCQQAVEKSAKALLALHEIPFRHTHDLNELGMQCAALDDGLAPLLQEATALTDFAVVFRYMEAPGHPDSETAESGLALAQRIYDSISGLIA